MYQPSFQSYPPPLRGSSHFLKPPHRPKISDSKTKHIGVLKIYWRVTGYQNCQKIQKILQKQGAVRQNILH